MTGILSPSAGRRYPLATVCRLWGLSRASLYRRRFAMAANEPHPPRRRRGPQGAASDADLLAAIREIIGFPLHGRGLSQDLGAAALAGLVDCCTSGAADHEGARPACASPAGTSGGAFS